MKIPEAENLYKEKGANALEKDYRDLVTTYRFINASHGIPNSDYLHALYLTDIMFRESRHNIRILSGASEDGWLDVLSKALEQAVRKIQESGGFLRAILLSEKTPTALLDLQKKYGEEYVQYINLATARRVPHFIACDSRMVRLEDEHDPITPETDTDSIRANVYLNNKSEAKTTEEFFDKIWSVLQKNK